MAVIRFSERPTHSWVVAGWVYRQVLEDVMSNCQGDSLVVSELGETIDTDGLIIDLLEPSLAARITDAIKQVAAGILAGTLKSRLNDQTYGDARATAQYHEALRDLLKVSSSAQDFDHKKV